jgi:hypothetical protein
MILATRTVFGEWIEIFHDDCVATEAIDSRTDAATTFVGRYPMAQENQDAGERAGSRVECKPREPLAMAQTLQARRPAHLAGAQSARTACPLEQAAVAKARLSARPRRQSGRLSQRALDVEAYRRCHRARVWGSLPSKLSRTSAQSPWLYATAAPASSP